MNCYTEEQPDHGEGHVRSVEELEIGEWYSQVHFKTQESKPYKLTTIFDNDTILLEDGLDRDHIHLSDRGIISIHNGKFHGFNWLKHVEAPKKSIEVDEE